jgi:hypothetical protein
MYMCSAEWSGTVTPHIAPTARDHWPAQIAIFSHEIAP